MNNPTINQASAIDAVRNGHGRMIHADDQCEEYSVTVGYSVWLVTYFVADGTYIAENANDLARQG